MQNVSISLAVRITSNRASFVCTVNRKTDNTCRFRDYPPPGGESAFPVTIWQAALATSAATTFFEPVTIHGRTFADGGLGANNPVDEVEAEAQTIWKSGPLQSQLKCFISVGTGHPGTQPHGSPPRQAGGAVLR